VDQAFSQAIGKDRLQGLFFWDYGVAENDTLLPNEDPHVILSSIGPGIRYSFNQWMSLRFDYGFQLADTAQAGAGRGSNRGHLSMVLSY
jgi:hemolysin activation/secretion protein